MPKMNPFPVSLEYSPSIELPMSCGESVADRGAQSRTCEADAHQWCTQLFPLPHNEVQKGVVDYLLHGAGDREADSLQFPNMLALGPHIKSVLESMTVPEDEATIAQHVADAVQEVQRRAYTKGIPATAPLVMPRNDTVPPNVILGGPQRVRPSLMGLRVAPIEGRFSTPGAIRTSRLHGVGPMCQPQPQMTGRVKSQCVTATLESIVQPL